MYVHTYVHTVSARYYLGITISCKAHTPLIGSFLVSRFKYHESATRTSPRDTYVPSDLGANI